MSIFRNVPRFVGAFSNRGLSLIELMIALVIGVLLSGAVTIIYVNNKHAYVAQDNMANLQENGRMALHLLREDVRMAGYWGLNYSPDTITNSGDVSLGEECATGWATDYANPFVSVNNDNTGYDPCVPDADYKANTDILTIRRASSNPVTVYHPGHLYLRTSLTEGSVSKADSGGTITASVAEVPAATYEVLAHAYYVRPWSETAGDGIPSLVREVISGGAVTTERLVEYVEDFQVTFGLDTDGDGSVDRYENDGISAGEVDSVMSIIVETLVRANTFESNYTNTRTYQMGDRVLGPFNDGFRRQVFRDTLFIRNWSGLGI